ncbi:FAD-binding oxidoreductase [Roseibium polysiphoniae]|uniref:FAD-binding oxidoreductase n=1 Tax=Roseibium polysiphoniae TaxID=2571221 RepID=A0ABR9CCY8_9HYPH|nr:FAD-binding oxidoreductase [Roseibium polysiphoniae]MBD8877743.1 FAD-binding oxidoreductase [Roseibium polysiphoniae]
MDYLPALIAELGGLEIADDPATLRLKSRDFFWFSPLLKRQLEDCRGDVVVRPRNIEEVMKIAAVVAKTRSKITVRGGGTGNYGQAVPLEGGVILDMGALDRVISLEPGVGTFEAGATMLEIDKALAPKGWELRFYPSTRKQATIGGFVAGGAAGAGSCTWGQLSDPGAVLAVDVVTIEEEPRVMTLEGSDVRKVLHAYGVNGVIVSVTVPLAPAHTWAEKIVVFPTLEEAAAFGQAFTEADGIAKKLVSVFDPRIPPKLGRVGKLVPEGKAAAIVMVSEPQAGAMTEIAGLHNGDVVFERGAKEAESAAFEGHGTYGPLYEYTWNHTTLHALKRDPAITYLQVKFPPENNLEIVNRVASEFGDEVQLHLEFQRRFGRVTCSALPLVTYSTDERLYEVIERLEALGAQVSNPHTYVLDNAGWKRVDAPQPEFKRIADPHALMNPGKLVS